MTKRRSLVLTVLAAALAAPAEAQFAFSLQQNGQASPLANGGVITMNAPALTQTETANVVVTYTGSFTANFPAAGQLAGNGFTVTGDGPATLTPFQSLTITLTYTPPSASRVAGEFFWPFNEVAANGATVSSGTITFNLVGTVPNLLVGQVPSAGTFQVIASGGTILFPATSVNAVSTVTIGIQNAGSGPDTINSITVSGAGYQTAGLPILPVTINPGVQLNFSIQFQPTAVGTAAGSLQISYGSGSLTASLSGTGYSTLLAYTVTEGGTSTAVTPGQTITLPDTTVGSKSTAVVQFQNTGATAVVVNGVAVNGAGFTVTDAPFFPLTLQPQQSNSITLTYSPVQPGPSTGRLQIGGDTFTLSGQGLGPLLTFSYTAAGNTQTVAAGGVITVPSVVDGQTSSISFTVTNTGSAPAPINSIGVVDPTGVFTLANLPALPIQLSPAGTATFTVNYTPVGAGVSTATLAVNNAAFVLSGFPATPPPLPPYQFTGASGTQQPFQQPAIGLSLTSPYAYALSGTLTLSLASSSFGVDNSVQFASGGKVVAFTIPANTLQAVFPGGATQIQLQTGTSAGTITVTPAFTVGLATGTSITPVNPLTLQLTVPALAPTLLTASISAQTVSSLTVAITGFSTVRSLGQLTIQLTPASGYNLSATSFTIDVSSAAASFFGASLLGGQFTVQVPFNLSENNAKVGADLTAAIGGVSVSATNATGASNVLQVPVP